MPKRSLRVLVATDGSRQARAALAATLLFPWPDGTRVQGVMVSNVPGPSRWRRRARATLVPWLRQEAARVQRTLNRRWADAEVVVRNPPVVNAIVDQARKWGAQVIVLGSRGRGILHRALLGSVSRDVAHEADCAVLVIKGRLRRPSRLVIGVDGSIRSRRAVAFISRLPAPRGSRVTVLAVVDPISSASISLMPASVRAVLAAESAAHERARMAEARREVSKAAQRLRRAGWAVEPVVRRGIPLAQLLDTASTKRADVIVVGARGATGLTRLLLGSVAEGVLAQSPGSVLIIK